MKDTYIYTYIHAEKEIKAYTDIRMHITRKKFTQKDIHLHKYNKTHIFARKPTYAHPYASTRIHKNGIQTHKQICAYKHAQQYI